MIEATQSAQLSSFVVGGIDIRTFFGVSGVPVIESFVKYLREEWKLPKSLCAPASVLSGIGLNLGLSYYMGMDAHSAILTGALVGLLASGWHELTK